jgi:hypothetical protein
VVAPKPFKDEASFRLIRPIGGGGTDFQVIFDYVRKHMRQELPSCIIILTDGYAPFPAESEAMNIPVLWLLFNEQVQPPWGRIARILVDEKGSDCINGALFPHKPRYYYITKIQKILLKQSFVRKS